jgi:hypothetical protein
VAYWLQGLAGYSHDVAPQKVVPSLAGLYVLWAPWNLRLVLTGLCLAAAVALTVVWWWRLRNIADVPFLAVAWLWLVWFLATPYVHIDDEVLLVIPVLALVGRNGDRLTQPLPVLALLLLFFAPLPSTWMVVMLAFPALLLALHAMSHPMATLRWALIAYGLLALSLVMSVLWLPVDGGSLKLLALAVCLFGAVPPELVPRPDQREVGIGLGSWAARLRAG